MPIVRKVSAQEAESWHVPPPQRTHAPNPHAIAARIQALGRKRGITRIDRDGPAGGEHAWRARVYARGIEFHKQFSDARYGGVWPALHAALAWRDQYRSFAGPRPPRRGWTPRIVRAEYRRMCGWIAYTPSTKRYFADSAWGGREAGYAAAQAWMTDITANQ